MSCKHTYIRVYNDVEMTQMGSENYLYCLVVVYTRYAVSVYLSVVRTRSGQTGGDVVEYMSSNPLKS